MNVVEVPSYLSVSRWAFVGSGVGFDDLPLVLAMSRDTR
jgi:hypothetical protein